MSSPDGLPWQPHRTPITVRFAELDPYNHVNHAVYVTYFEVARTEALASVGLGLDELAVSGFQLVVTDLSVRYRRAASAGQQLIVETWITEVRRASSVWSQRIIAKNNSDTDPEVVFVTGEVKAGVTDKTGRPTRPPEWLFERASALIPPNPHE